MARLPDDYESGRRPVPGERITEGVDVGELFESIDSKEKEAIEITLTDRTWANGFAKAIGLLPEQPEGDENVSTDGS